MTHTHTTHTHDAQNYIYVSFESLVDYNSTEIKTIPLGVLIIKFILV